MRRATLLGSLVLLGIALLLAASLALPPVRTVPAERSPAPVPSPVEKTPPLSRRPAVDPVPVLPLPPGVVHPKSGRYVAAWMPTEWDTDKARASFEANLDFVDEISPVWYEMRRSGTLLVLGGAQDATLVEAAHAAAVLVLPSITNGFDPDRTGYVLKDADRRSTFVQRILDEVDNFGYDGVDIDFEGVPAGERDAFTAFMRQLALGLHERGKLLSIAIHPRTNDTDGAPGARSQDWFALGQIVDRFRIMTYDYHWRGGGPGPVAPIYWVREVVEYARSQHVDPAKIEVGVPFYGYDWAGGGEAQGVTWQQIQELLETYEPRVNLLESDQRGEVAESWFTYWTRGGSHTVWFASQRSLEAKLDLVIQYDLAGIAIWRLGGEDPAYWRAIREKLTRDPYEVQRSIVRYLPDP